MTLLGVNIDHVATLRQARGEGFPDPVAAAKAVVEAGADGITAHLREDRRHIQDDDIRRLKKELKAPLNLEMAAAPEIVAIAAGVKPAWVCLVPEKRKELTTEGGLDIQTNSTDLRKNIALLKDAGIRVSLFIEPNETLMGVARDLGADAVELHTGAYARVFRTEKKNLSKEVNRIKAAAEKAAALGLVVNAGHGIDYENVVELAQVHPFHEFNIGFSIVARAVFVGLPQAVKEMKLKMRDLCAAS
jgi:pyridoxine 5-phosphate synthase